MINIIFVRTDALFRLKKFKSVIIYIKLTYGSRSSAQGRGEGEGRGGGSERMTLSRVQIRLDMQVSDLFKYC